MLQKIFGQFGGTGIKVEQLEAKFLAKNPEYAQGTKRKQDAKEKAVKVLIEGLTTNIPEGYVANKELQAQVHERYVAFTNAVKEDVALAGLGKIDGYQVDSIMVGRMVHQYFRKGKFGEGV